MLMKRREPRELLRGCLARNPGLDSQHPGHRCDLRLRISTCDGNREAVSSKGNNRGARGRMEPLVDVKCGDGSIVICEDHGVTQVGLLPAEWPGVINSTEAIVASLDDPANSKARDTFPRVDRGQRSQRCGSERTRKWVASALRKRCGNCKCGITIGVSQHH